MATKDTFVQLIAQIILVSIVLQYVGADNEFYMQPLFDKKKGNMTVSNLCVNGKTETCTKMTMEQVTSICGGSYVQDFSTPLYHNYTKITEVKCNGTTCHAEIATNSDWYHSGLDCTQNGTTASCLCQPYEKIKQRTTPTSG